MKNIFSYPRRSDIPFEDREKIYILISLIAPLLEIKSAVALQRYRAKLYEEIYGDRQDRRAYELGQKYICEYRYGRQPFFCDRRIRVRRDCSPDQRREKQQEKGREALEYLIGEKAYYYYAQKIYRGGERQSRAAYRVDEKSACQRAYRCAFR